MSKRAHSLLSVFAVAALALSFGAPAADAALIDVLVESSAGSGIFDVNLGQIGTFDRSGETVAQTYQLGNPITLAYNGDVINPTVGTSQLFFTFNSNGLNLYWIHDSTANTAGGVANTTVSLMDPLGNNDPMSYLLQDDPGSGAADQYTQIGDDFTASNSWFAGKTDGFVIGGLNSSVDSGWMLLANFNGSSSGWQATSGSGVGAGDIDLSSYINSGASVKFQLSQVPEPGTIALFGLGLVGLFGLRRKRQ